MFSKEDERKSTLQVIHDMYWNTELSDQPKEIVIPKLVGLLLPDTCLNLNEIAELMHTTRQNEKNILTRALKKVKIHSCYIGVELSDTHPENVELEDIDKLFERGI